MNWFHKGAIPRTPSPAARPSLPLHVQQPGARVTKRDFTLAIQVEGEADVVVPLDEVSELVIAGSVSLTTPTVNECLRRDISIALLT